MSRIAFSIHEIARVLAGDQTLFIRPARYSAAKIAVGDRLWVAEPFHLDPRFDSYAPTVALGMGAEVAYAADHVMPLTGNGVTHGKRHPARSMCRDWHRAHVIVRGRTELRLQDLTSSDLANLGHATRESFAEAWNKQISEWRKTMKWADNPAVIRFAFELVRAPLPAEDLPPLPRDRAAVANFEDGTPALSVAAAKAHAARHQQARKLSATSKHPLSLDPRPVRTVAAALPAATAIPARLAPSLPSLAEREAGLCRRCGSRLAFGCEHHPLIEAAE